MTIKDAERMKKYMPNKTLVPDKVQGYLLQVKHMLYELISLDNRVVSVEKLDDVAVEVDGIVVAAEQVKSVTSANNPISDRSPVFWKTLYNWCSYIEDGSLPPEAVLRFVIVANNYIQPGGIPESFANAHTDSDARNALKAAKTVILNSERAESSADVIISLPESYRDYVKYLFDAGREAIVCGIIKAMEIEIHSRTYDDDLLDRFGNQIIPPEYADILLTYMLGWVTQKVESFTKDNKPAYIAAKEYRDVLNAQIRAHNVGAILQAISAAPTSLEIDGEIGRLDTYIRQLKLIQVDDTALFEAAADFLRTKVEKVEWARRGIVTAQSFTDYNDALCRTWNDRKKLTILQHETDSIKCGQTLYYQCKSDSRTQRIQGVDTPSFFASGSLQDLANAPEFSPRIGWHPRYIDLLKGDIT